MGRGRAKAKQTKVARELKYHSPNTDLAALQRELAGSGKSDRDFDDEYDPYLDDDDEDDPADDDRGNWTPSSSR
ncbi:MULTISPECIES: DUF3073 domain-containing protein [Micromonosporaceae]|uniref:DUF3073 domain-containing protein n=1 Tax=Micromonosporaceae TaxID=28056 RepID=UPI000F4668DE|nr:MULTISPECIES: DUF3073 domain-containing protein [Micromonosporaceae]MDG4773834.1 DUF3073 domain-containing protein [Solwaraspora sp. WMMD792]ROO52263.1 DUF3073 family protein [Micromonospora sp. Llam0]WBB97073.1 DUF3073 domain-containing protein [Solwaraspora sp. WMMA2059]WBC19025.1 DUF3073 domain-containing protein [Solwaraspora sp. WMMA2080]WFE22585.1 DUF3073 domain-containing protein [Solwaraspora sp. WMMD937]